MSSTAVTTSPILSDVEDAIATLHAAIGRTVQVLGELVTSYDELRHSVGREITPAERETMRQSFEDAAQV